MTLIKSISGIRGIIGTSLNLDIIKKYVSAFSKISPKGTIVLAQDSRNSGKEFINHSSAILNQLNRKSINCGIIPTPTAQLLIEKDEYAGGIVFTASHNPKNWNGMKFINSDGIFINHQEFDLLEMKANKTYTNEYTIDNDMEDCSELSINTHINNILNLEIINKDVIRSQKIKVAIDCANGATSKALPLLLKKLNCNVTSINSNFNEDFGRGAEPIPENLNDLSQLVINSNSDIGFATDPDGDRLSIVDNNGKPLGEELTLSLAVYYFLEYFPNVREHPIVTNLSTTKLINYITKKYKTHLIRSSVGEINVVDEMIKNNSLLGGEGNGGVIYKHCHLGRDSLVGTAIILNLLVNKQDTISNIRNNLPYYFIEKSKISLPSRGFDLSKIVKTNFQNEKIIDVDGFKIEFKNGNWIHIRKSNTEPIIRIIAEGESKNSAMNLIKKIKKILDE